MGIIFLIAKIFELMFRMLLGSEIPAVVSTKDLLDFSLSSAVILIISFLYVRITLKKNSKINWSINFIGCISAIFFIIWVLSFWDELKYQRDRNLTLVDFVAMISSFINLAQYIFYKYKIDIKEKQKILEDN